MINHDDYKNHLHFLKFLDKKRNDRVHSRKSYIKYKNNVKTIQKELLKKNKKIAVKTAQKKLLKKIAVKTANNYK